MKKILFISLLFFQIHVVFSQQSEIKIDTLGKNINSEYADYVPFITADGKTLFFFRLGHPENTFYDQTRDCGDEWYSTLDNKGEWTLAKKLPPPFNRDQMNSIESISPDGNTILVHWAYEKGRSVSDGFSISHRTKEGWTEFEKLEIDSLKKLNQGMYYGASLAGNGKVLFIYMCQEKYKFANDIYVSFNISKNKWSEPKRLGAPINTDNNEISPFLAVDDVSLYFSSSRSGGLGDNDIYVSKRLDDTWLNWSEPVNLGAPINTEGFDEYCSLSASGDVAYLVTEKNSFGNEDIIRVRLKEENRPKPVVIISGKIRNSKTKEPIGSNIRYIVLPEGTEAGVARSSPGDGNYKIVLPYGKQYSFLAESERFISITENLDLTKSSEFKEIEKDLYLAPQELGISVRMNSLFFDSTNIMKESLPELNLLVAVLNNNPLMAIEFKIPLENLSSENTDSHIARIRVAKVTEYIQSKVAANPSRITIRKDAEKTQQALTPIRASVKKEDSEKPDESKNNEDIRQNNVHLEYLILKK